jgi:hypothetical protein
MIRNFAFAGVLASILVAPVPGWAQSPAETDALRLLSAFASYTDLRLRSVQESLEILAATTEARSGRWEDMKGLVAGYQESDGGLVAWYARPDGTYWTGDKGRMSVTLSDRDYFPDLMAGRDILGALVISKSTGQRSAVIAVPLKRGGKVVGAIGASVFLERLSNEVASALSLGRDAAFFALAPNGLTTLHRKVDRHFLDPRDLGSDSLKAAANEMLSKTSGTVAYEFDQTRKKALYRTSPLTQWRFVLTLDAAPPP